MKAVLLTIGGSILLLIVVMSLRGSGSEPTTQLTDRTSREVALACTTDMATRFHIHPTLKIVVNGEAQTVPPDIGVRARCMNALHTHDPIGTIHVESPEPRDFTLADFFAVWEQPFNQNQLLGYEVGPNDKLIVSIDGVEVDTLENTVLKEGEQIVITLQTGA